MTDLIWKDMRCSRTKITADQAAEAFAVWDCTKGYANLTEQLLQILGYSPQNDDILRIADKMLQKARKAGVIRHIGGGKWEWTT